MLPRRHACRATVRQFVFDVLFPRGPVRAVPSPPAAPGQFIRSPCFSGHRALRAAPPPAPAVRYERPRPSTYAAQSPDGTRARSSGAPLYQYTQAVRPAGAAIDTRRRTNSDASSLPGLAPS